MPPRLTLAASLVVGVGSLSLAGCNDALGIRAPSYGVLVLDAGTDAGAAPPPPATSSPADPDASTLPVVDAAAAEDAGE